jgi:uncharacterized protein
MAEQRRNERCPRGSGRKVKHCCGVRRGPSEAELAWRFLAAASRAAAERDLLIRPNSELRQLVHEMVELPRAHRSLRLLPTVATLDMQALLGAIEADDGRGVRTALPAVVSRVDTPMARGRLARTVLALRDDGSVPGPVAAVAMLSLSLRGRSSSSNRRCSTPPERPPGDIPRLEALLVPSRRPRIAGEPRSFPGGRVDNGAMHAAAVCFDLHVPESRSLKAKRAAVRPIIDGLRHKYRLSVAEVDHQDQWQRTVIAVAAVAESDGRLRQLLEQVERYVAGAPDVELIDVTTAYLDADG